MTGFINYLINGISLGSVYAIIALGYTMVYGIAKMLNFAHGDIIMVGSLRGLYHDTQYGNAGLLKRSPFCHRVYRARYRH